MVDDLIIVIVSLMAPNFFNLSIAEQARMSQCVFIVDDDPAVRDSISLWLSCHDYDTRCFADAKHFLGQVTQTLEGCIIADIRMPSMDGLELQAHLNKINCQLPLILLLAMARYLWPLKR